MAWVMTVSVVSSLTFMVLTHSTSTGMVVLIQTGAVSLTVGFFNPNF